MRSFLGRHKALTILIALALAITLPLAAWVYHLNRQLSEIPRFSTERPPGVDRPARTHGDAINILMLGADDPNGEDEGPTLEEVVRDGVWVPGAFRSDTIMVMHLDADRTGGQLVALPRDSWVEIPGQGQAKLNAAFSTGGPALTKQTVEQLTDLHLDHVMVVDFSGFKEITEIIGGVEVYVPETVRDTKLQRTWTQGTHLVEGEDALSYVRQRYGLANGDFDRIKRQQNFLRALADKTFSASVLTNPVRITNLAEQLADTVAVDAELTPDRIRSLALSMRSFDQQGLEFFTAPHNGTGTVGRASVVHLDVERTRGMFAALAEDRLAAWLRENDAEQLPDRENVS